MDKQASSFQQSFSTYFIQKGLVTAIRAQNIALGSFLTTALVVMPAMAAPLGGEIIGGSGSITTDELTTRVNQQTDLMAIDWNSFDVNANEAVRFIQPSSSSLVLNRIIGDSASSIRGSIDANGHVLLVNPRGVLFTDTATINVNGLVASGLDINPADFMSGNMSFTGEAGSAGVVVNQGVINASSASLIGRRIVNGSTGLVRAKVVSLVAADEALLTFDADGMMGVKVVKSVSENTSGAADAVLNAGVIAGQNLLLEGSVSADLFTAAVNNTGTIRAQGIDTSGGKITLFGSGGASRNSGTLDASGSSAGLVHLEADATINSGVIKANGNAGQGGGIKLLGTEVSLRTGSVVTADGSDGGGEVLIGGDYRGRNKEVRNATVTSIANGVLVSASATEAGDGGKLVVFALDEALVGGELRANAGVNGGNGGLVETSGKQTLTFNGRIEALGHADGSGGKWLIDPGYLDIVTTATTSNEIAVADINDQLAAGTNVDIVSSNSNGASSIRLLADIAFSYSEVNTATLSLFAEGGDASDTILIGANIQNSGTSGLNLVLNSTGDIDILAGSSIDLDGGSLVTSSVNFINNGVVALTGDATIIVGLNNVDSDNILGNFSAPNIDVYGADGSDKFTFIDASKVFVYGGISNKISSTSDVTNSNLVLSNVDQIFSNTAELNISSNGEAAIANDVRQVGVVDVALGGIDFVGLSTVVANGAGNEITNNLTAADQQVGLSDEYVVVNSPSGGSNGVSFSGFAAVNNTRKLVLDSSKDNELVITGNNDLSLGALNFKDVDSVLGGDGVDTVNEGGGWTLLGGLQQAESNNIRFSAIDVATSNSNTLVGSALADEFVVTGLGRLAANGIAFSHSSTGSKITTVNAGDQSNVIDSVVVMSGEMISNLNDNRFKTSDITFNKIDAASRGVLEFSNNDNTIDFVAGVYSDHNIAFSNLDGIDGGGGFNTVVGLGDWVVGADGNSVASNATVFTNIDRVISADGVLAGTGAGSNFSIVQDNGNNYVRVNDIQFGEVTTVNADGIADTATGLVDTAWYLIADANAAVANSAMNAGIRFNTIERISSDSAQLNGSVAADSFDLVAASSGAFGYLSGAVLLANGIEFSANVTEIIGAGEVDKLTALSSQDLVVVGGTITTSARDFSGLGNVTNGILHGSDGNDSFSFDSSGGLAYAGVTFKQLTRVDAGLGTDTVNFGDVWVLNEADNSAASRGLLFNQIEVAQGSSSTLTGSAGDDVFRILADGVITGNGIEFSSSAVGGIILIEAGGGDDTAVGLNAVEWNLMADSGSVDSSPLVNSASNNGVLINSLEFAETNANRLNGSIAADSFSINSVDQIKANGISFLSLAASGFTTIDAGSGADNLIVKTNDEVQIDGDNAVSISALSAVNVERVTNGEILGTSGDDNFSFDGDGNLISKFITFVSASSIDGGAGFDQVSGGTTWSLLVDVDVVDNSGGGDAVTRLLSFFNIEKAVGSATNLVGSSGDDSFVILGTGVVSGNGIEFSSTDVLGITQVNAGGGDDTVLGAVGAQWSLIADAVSVDNSPLSNSANNDGVLFNQVEIAKTDTSTLNGSTADDSFVVTGNGLLSANGISFVSSAVLGFTDVFGNTGVNDLVALENGVIDIVGNNHIKTSGIEFSGIANVANGKLLGSEGDDVFALNADGDLFISLINFKSLNTVDGLGGLDTVSGGSLWSLGDGVGGGVGKASTDGIIFNNIEKVVANNTVLQGSDDADSFVIDGSGSLTAGGIAFTSTAATGFTEISAGGGNDSVTVLALTEVSSDGSNIVTTSGMRFSDIRYATNGDLLGTSGDDVFAFSGALNDLDYHGVTFSSLSSVKGNGGGDSVSGGDIWTLTGGLGAATSLGIAFEGIAAASGSATLLQGSTLADEYSVISDGRVDANGIAFTSTAATGFTDIVGNGGADSLVVKLAQDVTALGSQSVNTNGMNFSGISRATNGNLVGTAGDDVFLLQADGSISFVDIFFNQIDAVDGAAGKDSILGASNWELSGGLGRAITGGREFRNVELAQTSSTTLMGSAGDDTFAVLNGGIVAGNGIEFSSINAAGITLIDAAGGSDSAAGLVGSDWTLIADAASLENNPLLNSASNSGVAFNNLENAETNTAQLYGSLANDQFVATADGQLSANNIAFTSTAAGGFGQIIGIAGNNSVQAQSDVEVSIAGDNSIITSNMIFSQISDVINGKLYGTDGDDVFTFSINDTIVASLIKFTSLNSIDGLAGRDTVVGGGSWTLLGGEGKASTYSTHFSNIEVASGVGTVLTGSNQVDQFEVVSAGVVRGNGIEFSSTTASGIISVDGISGSDRVIALAADQVILQSNNNVITTGGMEFSNIFNVTNGLLKGTDGDDTFTFDSLGNFTSNAIQFNALSGVDGLGGNDTVEGGRSWTLGDVANSAFSSLGTLFNNIELAEGDGVVLTGTAGVDNFTVINNSNIMANNITFISTAASGFSTVNALDGVDTIVQSLSDSVQMLALNSVKSGLVTFNGIERINAATVMAKETSNDFALTAANQVTADGIVFSNVTEVVGGASIDTVTGADSWALVGGTGNARSMGVSFEGIEVAQQSSAVLNGSAQGDSFAVVANNQVRANGIAVTRSAGVFSQVNGLNGSDSLVAIADVELTGIENEVNTSAINFSGLTSISASQLSGTADVDVFTVTGNKAISTYGMTISGLNLVTGGTGDDQLIATGVVAITANSNELVADGMTFSLLRSAVATSLNGSNGADVFSINGSGIVDVNGLTVSGLSQVNGAGASDTVIDNAASNWSLTGSSQQVTNNNITFSGVEVAQQGGSILHGSSLNDQFNIASASQLTANGVTFNAVKTVNAGAGSDSVSGPANQIWLVADANQVSTQGYSFTGIDTVTAANIALEASGSSVNRFEVGAADKSLTAGAIALNGVASVNAGDDASDTLVSAVANRWSLNGTDKGIAVRGITFAGIDNVQAHNAEVVGNAGLDTFSMGASAGDMSTAAINFTGVTAVNSNGGKDVLRGSSAADLFNFQSNGALVANTVSYSGISSVDAGAGADRVGGSANGWSIATSGSGSATAVVNNSAITNINNVAVVFTNIENVSGVGVLNGGQMASSYQLNDINQVSFAGMIFEGVNQLNAGSASDSLIASNQNANWSLSAGSSRLSSTSASLIFNGIDSVFSGSGQDTFAISGGVWNTVNTGAGADMVSLTGGRVNMLQTGSGSDSVDIYSGFSSPIQLRGGADSDQLSIHVDSVQWKIDKPLAQINTAGDYTFSEFEVLNNNANNFLLDTAFALSLRGTGADLVGSGMAVNFGSGSNLTIKSSKTGANALVGDVSANLLNITTAGDVDIGTTVGKLNIVTTGPAINVAVVAQRDLYVGLIDAGSNGSIALSSDKFGDLTVDPQALVNFVAKDLDIGSDSSSFSFVGDEINPLRISVSNRLSVVSLSYVEPLYVSAIPLLTSFTGDKRESVYGVQASQGVKSAVQTAVEDFTQVDPAIFESVTPYSIGVGAVSSPEFRLVAGVLLPASATAAGDDTAGDDKLKEKSESAAETETGSEGDTIAPDTMPLPELRDDYPETYQIREGDTLWNISEKFLKNPKLWKQLWQQNPNVKNPNKIFPGDVIKIIILQGKGFLTLKSAPLKKEESELDRSVGLTSRKLKVISV